MPLPNVTIELLNDQLGRQDSTDDGVSLLVLTGVAVVGSIQLLDPRQIFTPDDAVALGLDAAYDTANGLDVNRQINEFYDTAERGAELWIMLYVNTMTMATVTNPANSYMAKALDAGGGRIRLVGVGRVPAVSYVPTVVDGMDDDVRATVINLHTLSNNYRLKFKPFRHITAGRLFQSVPATLPDLRLMTQNTGGITLATTLAGGKNPAVGLCLGKFSINPVQRKISRVKDGDLGILAGYMSDGLPVESYEDYLDNLHDKGYIFFRKFGTKSGYFFNSDRSCSAESDDYSLLARGRVIDKAMVIAYTTFVNEIEDDLEIDENGYMDPSVCKNYQSIIENAISLQMMNGSDGAEISGVTCLINPAQNLLATDKVQIQKLSIRPKGYSTYIDVPLGFSNPLNQS